MGPEAGRRVSAPLRHVLLLIQGALTALVAVETLLLGAAMRSPVLLWLAAVAIALSVLPVVLAFGLLRRRRRTRGAAVAYELVLLVSGYVNAVLLGNDDLVSLLVTVGLPVLLLCVLARYSSDRPEPSVSAG
jgi:hypothetical protein